MMLRVPKLCIYNKKTQNEIKDGIYYKTVFTGMRLKLSSYLFYENINNNNTKK